MWILTTYTIEETSDISKGVATEEKTKMTRVKRSKKSVELENELKRLLDELHSLQLKAEEADDSSISNAQLAKVPAR